MNDIDINIVEEIKKIVNDKRVGSEFIPIIELYSFLVKDYLIYKARVRMEVINNNKVFIARIKTNPRPIKESKSIIEVMAYEIINNAKTSVQNVIIDLVFDENFYLMGMILIKENNKISIFSMAEFQHNIDAIQPTTTRFKEHIQEYHKRTRDINNILYSYSLLFINQDELAIKYVGRTVYVYEYIKNNKVMFKHLSIDNLYDYFCAQPILTGKVYISLPFTYVPGKAIDIGYFDRIDEGFLKHEDIAVVIGFGAGLDLIHTAKRCKSVVGIELNIMGIISTNVNLNISRQCNNIDIICADFRDIVSGVSHLPKVYNGFVNKVIWGMPYESSNTINNPKLLCEYFDNYTVFEWFLPFLSKGEILKENWEALVWNLFDDFKKYKSLFDQNNLSCSIEQGEYIGYIYKKL